MKKTRYSILHEKKVKKTVAEAIVFFREGISYLWGIAKNYKNVLGGYK